MEESHEILKDPVHGYIRLYNHEREIIDTPIFQRLRHVKQLTAVDYAYPGAVHTRFSHSIGVMHVAGVFAERLLEKIPKLSQSQRQHYYYLMRLWGLVHDIGHGPFSHLFDDIVLGPRESSHETVGAKIVKTDPDVTRIKLPWGITNSELSSIIQSDEEWPLTEQLGNGPTTARIFRYVCTGAYSADIIDYLLRDSLFTGAGYGAIDWQRLIGLSQPEKNRVVLSYKAEDAFDSFLLARLFMFSTVYYHRTVRAFTKVAAWFLRDLEQREPPFFDEYVDNDYERYSQLSDPTLIPEMLSGESQFGKMLIHRKSPYSTVDEISLPIISLAQTEYLDADIMTRAVSEASRLSLPPEAFFVDTPKIQFNPMLREQKIHIKDVDGKIRERNVRETRWGALSMQMSVARLYIHDAHAKHASRLKRAFRKPTTSHSRKKRTFY
jgi:HD superfamily phosphohydrolase